MELTIGILLDELADFKPVLRKAPAAKPAGKTAFKHIVCYDPGRLPPDSFSLYLFDAASARTARGRPCPKHLFILGDDVPQPFLEGADTGIQVTGAVKLERLFQVIMNLSLSYEEPRRRATGFFVP
jgi:hypothetical protein